MKTKLIKFINLSLSLILIFTPIIPQKQVSASVQSNASEVLWHTVQLWEGEAGVNRLYHVYKVIENGQTKVVYAKDNNFDRVSDPKIELQLVFIAASMDKPSSQIPIPISGGWNPLNSIAWGKPYTRTSLGYPLYVPNFFDYVIPSDFVESSIANNDGLLWGQGLNIAGKREEIYAQVILQSILQSTMSYEVQSIRKKYFDNLYKSVRRDIKYDTATLEFWDKIYFGTDVIHFTLEKQHQLSTVFSKAMDRTTGAASIGFKGLNGALKMIELDHEVKAHNLRAAMEFQLAIGDADQRLHDLERLFCAGTCTEANVASETFDPALIRGLIEAVKRFNQMKAKQAETWIQKLNDPNIAITTTELIASVAGVVIGLLKLTHVITGGASLILDAAVMVVEFTIIYNIDQNAGRDNIRRFLIAYTLAERILALMPDINLDRRYALNILNIYYFNLYFYFWEVYTRASSDTTYWIFEEDWNRCYIGNITEDCIQDDVRLAALNAFNSVKEDYFKTIDGTYLNENEREQLSASILIFDGEKSSQISVALTEPADAQYFSQGTIVPLQAAASSPAGIRQVSFYIFPQNGNRGSAYCTDIDGPDSQGRYTCPGNPGWSVGNTLPGIYHIQTEAINAYGNAKLSTIHQTIINVEIDNVAVTATLSPDAVIVEQTFSASGMVTLNGSPAPATVQLEVIGQGIIRYTQSVNGNYSISNIPVPALPGNYTVRISAATPKAAGHTDRMLYVSAKPMAGVNVGIVSTDITHHVKPGGDVQYNLVVKNYGKVETSVKIRYELFNPNGSRAYYTDSNLMVLPAQSPGYVIGPVYLGPTGGEGSYRAVVRLVDTNGNIFYDETTNDNLSEVAVQVSSRNDYDQYILDDNVYSMKSPSGSTIGQTEFPGDVISMEIISSGVSGGKEYAELKIRRNGSTVIQDDFYEVTEYYISGGTIILYIHDIQYSVSTDTTKVWAKIGVPTSYDFSVKPSNPLQAKGGLKSVLRFEAPDIMYNIGIRFGVDSSEVKSNWGVSYVDRGGTKKDMNMRPPLAPGTTYGKTYEFYVGMQRSTSTEIFYLQKVGVQVIQPDDVGVSALTPANGSSYFIGESVAINTTIQNFAPYLESLVPVALQITGPNGYALTQGRDLNNLNGNSSMGINFTWDTGALEPGNYTIQVTTSLGNDPIAGNNTQSRSISLQRRPTLVTTANAGATSYHQQELVLLTAIVLNSLTSAPVTDAQVYARINTPSGTQNYAMSYNSSAARYEIQLAFQDLGSYSYAALSAKDGYLSGESSSISFSITNAPPETWFTQTSTGGPGELISSNSAHFEWAGSDISLPASQLLYSTKLDAGGWSAYSNSPSIDLTGLAEGAHTFSVRAYDGADADPSPAQWSFTVDTQAPVFETTPTANLSQIKNLDTLIITFDVNETVSPQINLFGLDSGFSPANLSVVESNPSQHIYQATYQLTENNFRPDGLYTIPIFAYDLARNFQTNTSLKLRLENSAPWVVSFAPGWGDEIHPQQAQVTILFSEEMNRLTAEGAFSILPHVGGTFTWEDNLMRFTPSSPLALDTDYTVALSAQATDLAGKPLAPEAWAFRTIAEDKPLGPYNLSATRLNANQVQLNWQNVATDALEILVERSVDGTHWFLMTTLPASATTYTDSTGNLLNQYRYRLRAYRQADGKYSDYSNQAIAPAFTIPKVYLPMVQKGGAYTPGALEAPDNLYATAVSTSQINLTWQEATDASEFRVERSVDGQTGWSVIGNTPAYQAWFNDTGLTCGTRYFYRVQAYRQLDQQFSAYSPIAQATTLICPLEAPTLLTATTVSETQIDLSWQDNADSETGYRIERSPNGSLWWEEVGNVGADVSQYRHGGLQCGTRLYFRVRAYRSSDGKSSPYSNIASGATANCPFSSISGRVIDGNANPIPHVLISASNGFTTTTDITGQFTFHSMADGTYVLTPSLTDYSFTPVTRSVTVPPNAENINFTGDRQELVVQTIIENGTVFPDSFGAFYMTVGDLTNDGKVDLVVTKSLAASAAVFQRTNGAWDQGTLLEGPSITNAHHPRVAAIRNDGQNWLMYSEHQSGNNGEWLRAHRYSGTTLVENKDITTRLGTPGWMAPAAADLNNDNKLEIWFVSYIYPSLNLYRYVWNPATSSYSGVNIKNGSNNCENYTNPDAGDFNGDGKQELVWLPECTILDIVSYTPGSGTYDHTSSAVFNTGENISSFDAGEFNGAPGADIAVATWDGTQAKVYLISGTTYQVTHLASSNEYIKVLRMGDLDGDHKVEIYTAGNNGGIHAYNATSGWRQIANYPGIAWQDGETARWTGETGDAVLFGAPVGGTTFKIISITAPSASLYSHFSFENKNDTLGFAPSVEVGPVSYTSGHQGAALEIPPDQHPAMLFLGDSYNPYVRADTYRDFMYGDQSMNVWIKINQFNSLTDGSMMIIGGAPGASQSQGGCIGSINQWALSLSNISNSNFGYNPLPGNEKIDLWVPSYLADGTSDASNTVNLDAMQGRLTANQWYMITITHNSTTHTWKIYVNGNLEASITKPAGIGPGALTRACPYAIGGRSVTTQYGYPFAGQIDELSFWHGVLSASQIFQLYLE